MTLNNKKKITLTIATALLLVLSAAQFAQAASPPQPNHGTAIIIDGDLEGESEWILTGDPNDFFADMYRAGTSDENHPKESELYLRYDPSTSTLYILVLTIEGPVIMENDEAWVKINGNVKVDGSYPDSDFAWINPDTNTGYADGFEAKIYLPQGSYTIDVHVNVWNDGESQTSRPLEVLDLTVVPEVAIGTTIVAVIAAAALFAVYKHKKQ